MISEIIINALTTPSAGFDGNRLSPERAAVLRRYGLPMPEMSGPNGDLITRRIWSNPAKAQAYLVTVLLATRDEGLKAHGRAIQAVVHLPLCDPARTQAVRHHGILAALHVFRANHDQGFNLSRIVTFALPTPHEPLLISLTLRMLHHAGAGAAGIAWTKRQSLHPAVWREIGRVAREIGDTVQAEAADFYVAFCERPSVV